MELKDTAKKYMNMKHLEAALDDTLLADFIQPEFENSFAHKF